MIRVSFASQDPNGMFENADGEMDQVQHVQDLVIHRRPICADSPEDRPRKALCLQAF